MGPNSIIFVVFDIFLSANIISVMLTTTFQQRRRKQLPIFWAAAKEAKLNFLAEFRRTLQNTAAAAAKFSGTGVYLLVTHPVTAAYKLSYYYYYLLELQ